MNLLQHKVQQIKMFRPYKAITIQNFIIYSFYRIMHIVMFYQIILRVTKRKFREHPDGLIGSVLLSG
jgi:hypothetical protein